nr:glyoxalase/bleomycin resistance/dioxygenase family protein [Myxococcales bacterium]
PEHYGIQVQTTETVRYWAERMEKAGYPGRWETQVHCCYAEQDKVWVQDPDGRSWEIFMVLRDDSETYAPPAVAQHGKAVADACCAPTCCT